MHWLLSIPDTFSLRNTIQRSGWLLYPPYHVQTLGTQLSRIEQLGTNEAVSIALYQAPAGLVLNTEAQLSGQEVEEASAKVWRMLRLEDNFQPFLRLARHSAGLETTARTGARVIRGATIFEDTVTAALVTVTNRDTLSWELVGSLVDRLGAPLPSNPTLRAFPPPARVLRTDALANDSLPPVTVERVIHIARIFHEAAEEVNNLLQQPLSADNLASALTDLLKLPAESVGLLMLKLGRYDYIPDDDLAQRRMLKYGALGEEDEPQDARHFFSRWHPWGGLAYWLWNWSHVSTRASVALNQ